MTIDFTGIKNENAFYSHYYLTAILENDLRERFKTWEQEKKESGKRPPYAVLRSLAADYFQAASRLEKTRDPAEKLEIQRAFSRRLLEALGYPAGIRLREARGGAPVPVFGEVTRQSGAPELWVIEAFNPNGDEADPLALTPHPLQYPEPPGTEGGKPDHPLSMDWETLITREIFGRTEPPRWVILTGPAHLILLDRTKWDGKRLIRFDLAEIFGRKEPSTFKVTAAILHRDSVCPADGLSLLDTLDENAHKHAFAVSEDLKYALRRSIEALGNEAVWYLGNIRKEPVYDQALARRLTRECLRYMYRLLFLFFIEARPELGYAPMNADAYRDGYSLETLRDLELVRLTTPESRDGYFIHNSIQLLFDLIYNGHPPQGEWVQQRLAFDDRPIHHTFRLSPLNCHLFDPGRTPLLNKVRFRNSVLQGIIKRMSLTRPKGRKARRGRVSHAGLGINQLGAVYEALLSYSGFFAETDLYEVKREGDRFNALETGYFVPADALDQYTDGEKFDGDGALVHHPKGRFIYRLAGRERQKFASYYTPESLTRCLVKYALQERLKNLSADAILDLTICEPAMGSAAFLNEAVSQLAEAYLQKKQAESGREIPQEAYAREKQKTKMAIAGANVYGVDLNPVAVELAEVSLWLNTIDQDALVPWFNLRLACGNSLIGARRQVFDAGLLKPDQKGDPLWLDAVPDRVAPGGPRPENAVYHFLLPDRAMARYADKVIRKMVPEEIKAIAAWRRAFIRPFSESERTLLLQLSEAADRLWSHHAGDLRSVRRRTADAITVWGQLKQKQSRRPLTTAEKDRIHRQVILGRGADGSTPGQRLKMVMDYWCALWFWPLERTDLLPTRAEYLLELSLLLEGNVLETASDVPGEQLSLFGDDRPVQLSLDLDDPLGRINVERLCDSGNHPRLALVRELAERYRFFHWELVFADLFEERGGFDLVLGNPPWIKVEWDEGGVMGDAEPLFVLRKFTASKLNRLREETLEKYDLRSRYLGAFEEAEGVQNFLNAEQNYPVLKGVQTNLYKCFLPQAWMLGNADGVSGFLHPEGVYDDPKGQSFRAEIYPRLRSHFQFQNELNLFAEVDHHAKYSVNIFGQKLDEITFAHISNLYAPKTVDECINGEPEGGVPGLKDENNKWNVKGHPDRVITVKEGDLALFAKLYDSAETQAVEARLPALHSTGLITVLKTISEYPKRLSDMKGACYSTVMWDETNAIKKDGTIRRETRFPDDESQWILSGPHFFVGNPFNKTPRDPCTKNSDYDVLDLSIIPEDYLPRTNYIPGCSLNDYKGRCPNIPWNENATVTDHYRLFCRRQLSQSGERTLIPTITPPNVGHINPVISTTFADHPEMVAFAASCASIPFDFFIKTTGKGDLYESTLRLLPKLDRSPEMMCRMLTLVCLTQHYAALWAECWQDTFQTDRWAKNDPRLADTHFTALTKEWYRDCALRTDYARRQALVEIDVLAAMALGLTREELITIYRIQFPVLRQYEADTWYDQTGRIVFTCNKGLPGVGYSRPEWNKIKEMKTGTVHRTITDNTLPGGPRERTISYTAPFDRCDREADYQTVWQAFEERRLGG